MFSYSEEKIIIFHNGALGDFLLACPVFEGLARLLRKKVFFCTRSEYVDLVKEKDYYGGFLPGADSRFLPFFDGRMWKYAEVPEEFRAVREVFVFGQRGSKEFAFRLGKRLKINKCFWISSFPEEDFKGPVRLYLSEQLERIGYSVRLRPFYIRFPSDAMAKRESNYRSVVVIHPGSGGIKKVWPFKNWLSLMDYIKSHYENAEIKVILGPAEEKIREAFYALRKTYNFEIICEPKLLELAILIKQADLFIGNDSGVSHLAASSGTQVVVIFGPTDPNIWAPFGEKVAVVKDKWVFDEILNFDVKPDPSIIPNEIIQVLNNTLVNCATKTWQN